MKSRLAPSVHLLFTSKCWVNPRTSGSSRSIFTIFERRCGQIDSSFRNRVSKSWNRAIQSAALEDDDFSELGPQKLECLREKIKLATKKLDDIVDDDDFSELDTLIPECPDKEIKLVSEKPDLFMDDAFSELGPATSDYSSKKLKLVTEKRDHIPKNHSRKRELTRNPPPSDSDPSRGLMDALTRNSITSSTKPRSPVQESRSTDMPPFSDYKPNPIDLFGTTTKASIASPTKYHASARVPRYTDNKPLSLSTELHSSDCASARVPRYTDDKPLPSSTELRSPDHVQNSSDDTRKNSETKYPLSVSVKNIPSEIGLPKLIEAMSVFGKVSGASFVTTSDKFKCCNIEFEDTDSSKRAALAGKVKVGNRVFSVTFLGAVELVAVRIKNIKETTTDSAVHSICKSTGELVGLTRTSKNGVDAFFNVQNHTCQLDIIKKLNNTVFDHNHWSASVLTDTPNSSKENSEKEARNKLNAQIVDSLSMLTAELGMKRIILRDLEYLNAGIIYVQGGMHV